MRLMNSDPHTIDPFTATFADPVTESEFLTQNRYTLNTVSLWILLTMLATELLSWSVSLWQNQLIATHPFNLAAKGTYILSGAIGIYLLKTRASAETVSRFLLAFVMVYVFSKMGYQWVETTNTIRVLLNSFIMIFGLYVVAPIAFIHQFTLAILASMSSIVMLSMTKTDAAEWHRIALLIVFINGFGAIAANHRERQKRRMYANQIELDKALQHERALQNQNQRLMALLNHELRNPLASARTQVEAMAHKNPEAASDAKAVNASIDDAIRLLQEWSQINAQLTESMNGEIATRSTIEQAMDEVKKLHPGFPISIQDGPWAPLAIPHHMLKLVIKSLLINAATHGFSERGALITIRAGLNQTVHIRVRDWGGSQPRRRVQFRFQAHQKHRHTTTERGLGLHLIERFLEPEGGAIKLIGAPRLGTVVDLRLPLKALASA